ncbi:MAG: SulP family inorganic anion transporter [Verrucomicrobiota bacterium]
MVKRFLKQPLTLIKEVLQYSRIHPLAIIQAFLESKKLKQREGRGERVYSQDDFIWDLRAALNVALLAFPQGMAYAVVADLPIEYGIYGTIIAAIIGPLFSGSRFIVLGPTNATSVLLPVAIGTMALPDSDPLTLVPLLLLMAGFFLVLGSIFRIASLTQYISRSVVTGYITAAALYIIIKQAGKIFYDDFSASSQASLLEVIYRLFEYIPHLHLPSLLMGVGTAIVYLALSRNFTKLPNVAITLVVMSFVGFGWDYWQASAEMPALIATPYQHFNAVDPGQWKVTIPTFSYDSMVGLTGPALVIAFLSILEGSSIGKTQAARSGNTLNTNQEMFGMGIANLFCAIGSGMPASGSLTRSKLNADSGARTALASLYSGLICLLAILLVGPLIKYIPVPTLAVLIVFIGISLINRNTIRIITKSTPSDATVFYCTFLTSLLIRLDIAIILGATVSIILFLRKVSSPELVEYSFNDDGNLCELDEVNKRSTPQISIVHVEGELFFGAAELFRDQMRRVCDDENLKVIILRLKNAYRLDATSVMALGELIQYLRENDRDLIVSGARMDVYKVFKNSGLIDILGSENFFLTKPSNPNLSTRSALIRAQELIGSTEAEVKIYVDPNKD